MSKKTAAPINKKNSSKIFPWPVLIIVVVVLLLLPAGGFAFAASMESQDSFCSSCHTQPESTFYQRSTASQPVDLASYHAPQNTRCIDCHSGQGISGRLQAELLGAGNAFKWYSGAAVQPAPLTQPISDANCLKCHQQVTQRGYTPKNKTLSELGEAQNGHWHLFLTRWQAQSASAAKCVSCHSSHATDGDVKILYLNEQHTVAVCQACHQVMRED
jgi:hypothetical protein